MLSLKSKQSCTADCERVCVMSGVLNDENRQAALNMQASDPVLRGDVEITGYFGGSKCFIMH